MTSNEEFRQFGTAMINYVADYLENIRERPVVPQVTLSTADHIHEDRVAGFSRIHGRADTQPGSSEGGGVEDSDGGHRAGHHAWGHSLAPSTLPRLLPHSQQLPRDSGRYSLRGHRLHRVLLDRLPSLHRAGDGHHGLAGEDVKAAPRVPVL